MPYLSHRPLYLSADVAQIKATFNDPLQRQVALDLKAKGWAKLNGFATNALIEEILHDCEGQYGRANYRMASPHRLLDGWKTSQAVKTLATSNKITDLLSVVYGKTAFAFQTLNFDRGTQQAIHSDTLHFSSYPQHYMAGVWVALEDITEQNGPLRYIENSHIIPPIDLFSLGLTQGKPKHNNSHISYTDYENNLSGIVNTLNLITRTVTLSKGDAFIWTSSLLHGGAPILDPNRTRFSQVTHYFFDDCLYYTPLVSNRLRGHWALRTPRDIASGKQVTLSKLLKSAKRSGVPKRHLLRSWFYTKTGY